MGLDDQGAPQAWLISGDAQATGEAPEPLPAIAASGGPTTASSTSGRTAASTGECASRPASTTAPNSSANTTAGATPTATGTAATSRHIRARRPRARCRCPPSPAPSATGSSGRAVPPTSSHPPFRPWRAQRCWCSAACRSMPRLTSCSKGLPVSPSDRPRRSGRAPPAQPVRNPPIPAGVPATRAAAGMALASRPEQKPPAPTGLPPPHRPPARRPRWSSSSSRPTRVAASSVRCSAPLPRRRSAWPCCVTRPRCSRTSGRGSRTRRPSWSPGGRRRQDSNLSPTPARAAQPAAGARRCRSRSPASGSRLRASPHSNSRRSPVSCRASSRAPTSTCTCRTDSYGSTR